jgi:hypothetical protein
MIQGRQAVELGTECRDQARRNRLRGALAAFGLAAMLAGCGGGGDTDASTRTPDMNDDTPSTRQGTGTTTGGGETSETGQGGTGSGTGSGSSSGGTSGGGSGGGGGAGG